ncbi:MAG: universal stress protein [Thioalkalispiraceae bacterium]|jgi:nucleotide-binding universal stress UspA family protein
MKRFKNILYIYEGSVAQEATIASAVSLAQNNQADLTVIDVIPEVTAGIGIPPGGPISTDLNAAMITERRQMLESLITPYRQQLDIYTDVLVGIKFLEAIRAVLKNKYDLLIKPAENPDYIKRLFGSEDMHLLRKCPCPVWLMKAEETSNYECIVAAVDIDPYGSDSAEQTLNQMILELASSIALSDSAVLHLVHVWNAPQAGFASLWADNPDAAERNFIEGAREEHQNAMNKLTLNMRKQIGTEAYEYLLPRIHLHRGEAKKAIPELVRKLKADLVVMGTAARTGIPGFIIGNTAEAILDQLQCSVLAIKPPGFVSPVTLD